MPASPSHLTLTPSSKRWVGCHRTSTISVLGYQSAP